MEALASEFRPKEFKDVCAQGSIVKILEKQIQTKQFKNTYLLYQSILLLSR